MGRTAASSRRYLSATVAYLYHRAPSQDSPHPRTQDLHKTDRTISNYNTRVLRSRTGRVWFTSQTCIFIKDISCGNNRTFLQSVEHVVVVFFNFKSFVYIECMESMTVIAEKIHRHVFQKLKCSVQRDEPREQSGKFAVHARVISGRPKCDD